MWGKAGSGAAKPLQGRAPAPQKNPEIMLREELDVILYGDEKNIAHGHLLLIRHMRRDSAGRAIYCTCMADQLVKEPSATCSYCRGEGYLWDEQWHIGYSMMGGADSGLVARGTYLPPGMVRVDYKIYFLRYNCGIQYGDKIVEVQLDYEGAPQLPLIRRAIHSPQTVTEYRSDHGRLEFFAVFCREEDAIRPDEFIGDNVV